MGNGWDKYCICGGTILILLAVTIMLCQPVQQDVESCKYDPSEFVNDEFDCSNMAQMQRDHLVSKGRDVWIAIGQDRLTNENHAWLIVDGWYVDGPEKSVVLFPFALFYRDVVLERDKTESRYEYKEGEWTYPDR